MKFRLAFDIGASSGRAVLGHLENGRWQEEEIYRFLTPLVDEGNGHCHWDVSILFVHLLSSLKKAKELGKIPESVGIDSFGVDYALLDKSGKLIDNVVSYRDVRGVEARKNFLTPEKVFLSSGISPQNFDSVYQLYCDKQSGKLERASSLLFLPCFLAFLLTGKAVNEVSIASTSALLDVRTLRYAKPLLRELDLRESFFPPLVEAGYDLGSLKKEVADEVGYQCSVRMPLSHDTGSSFRGSLASEDEVLLSSGTWSLLGCIIDRPIVTKEAYEAGFTNELSLQKQVRFLKNIMGMWIINSLMKELGLSSFDQVVGLARQGSGYDAFFDATDASLLNPPKMGKAVMTLLLRGGHRLSSNNGELFYSVYHSLAISYASAIKELERLTGKHFKAIRIFGGGVKAKILNELTAKESGLPVHEGPAEATALGNLLSQGEALQ